MAAWFFWVWFYAERYAVTALHGLMRRQVCDVKKDVLVARVATEKVDTVKGRISYLFSIH